MTEFRRHLAAVPTTVYTLSRPTLVFRFDFVGHRLMVRLSHQLHYFRCVSPGYSSSPKSSIWNDGDGLRRYTLRMLIDVQVPLIHDNVERYAGAINMARLSGYRRRAPSSVQQRSYASFNVFEDLVCSHVGSRVLLRQIRQVRLPITSQGRGVPV